MAQGDANKVWIVPSDFGKALEGFTKMLGAPGGDGVFRFEPSPVDDAPAARPEEDDEAIKDWFDTSPDPEIARVVADAQAQARAEIPPSYAPSPPTRPAVPSSPPPGELPQSAGDGRVGLPAGTNWHASPERPTPGDRAAGSGDRPARAPERPDRSSGDRPPAERPTAPAPWSRPAGPQAGWSDNAHEAPRSGSTAPPAGEPNPESAVPTPPRGVRRVDEDPDTVEHVNPARPGYPSPPRSPQN
jgi:hypothetical protein